MVRSPRPSREMTWWPLGRRRPPLQRGEIPPRFPYRLSNRGAPAPRATNSRNRK
ncbi:hypothetical protein ACFFX0_09965 [Citricoccus parietis]|uniref:Uncharacterized protein n=1 Tax=Citricoccus parietis TaxID=592307 RepID=A0ABV5FXW1_9MICC